MVDPERPSIATRVRELVSALLSERGRPAQENGAEARSENAVEVVSFSADRWRATATLRRLLHRPGRDLVTRPGTWIELLAPVDAVARLRAATVRCRLGDTVVGERVADGAPSIGFPCPAPGPGVYPVRSELLDDRGQPIRSRLEPTASLLHVIEDSPTIAIDASYMLVPDAHVEVLRRLAAEGVCFVYVDCAEQDRTHEIRAAIDRLALPLGAVLVHPETEAEFRTLGVDFRGVFLTATLRRLAGSGVPLLALATPDPALRAAGERAGLRCGTIEALTIRPGQPTWREQARAFEEARIRAHDPFVWRLDVMTGTTAVGANACRIELDNRRARERLFELVEGARRELFLQFYLVRDGQFTDQLGARLIAAARRGVRVRVVVDALFSVDRVLGVNNAVVAGLRAEPGIEVVSSHPISGPGEVDTVSLKRRDHRKIIVVDGEIALIGGRNCADEYYTGFDEVAITDWTPHERIPWLDASIEVRGPLVRTVLAACAQTWNDAKESWVSSMEVRDAEAPEVGRTVGRLVLHHGVGDVTALLAYEAIIDAASRHLFIVNDFPIVPSLVSAIRRALARGVDVVIMTGSAVPRRGDGTFFRGPLHREAFEYMTKHRLGGLLSAGARVFEYATLRHPLIVCRGDVVRPYVHAKVVTADGAVASIGSANLDATASYWEREANVVVHDPRLVSDLEDQLRAMVAHSHAIDPTSESWRRESALREIAAQLWPEGVYS